MNRGDLVLTVDGYHGIIVEAYSIWAEVFIGNGITQPYALTELTPVPYAKDAETANFEEILK